MNLRLGVLFSSLFLFSCANNKTVAPIIEQKEIAKTEIVVVPETKQVNSNRSTLSGDYLPNAFKETIPEQKEILADPEQSVKVVHNLRKITNKARESLKPWMVKHPHPSESEVEKAIIAISALQTYITIHTEK